MPVSMDLLSQYGSNDEETVNDLINNSFVFSGDPNEGRKRKKGRDGNRIIQDILKRPRSKRSTCHSKFFRKAKNRNCDEFTQEIRKEFRFFRYRKILKYELINIAV